MSLPLGMMKTIEFSTQNSLGQFFAEAIDITPRSYGLVKIAGSLHPELAAFLKDLKPHPGFQYVLMTPMGAFEYWGMNANGDLFPEISLSYDKTSGNPLPVVQALTAKWLTPFGKTLPVGNYQEFGFKTFLAANRYRHHANKDPSKSYGGIVCAVWNPTMHRVELIVRHDREAAKRVGAEDIVKDFDENKPRQISMGCKVPFDVCTACGHISRTPHDYCVHLKTQMGSVLDDGAVVGAVNFFPRFFDLSDVFVPAAKESGTLMKVASAGVEAGRVRYREKRAEIGKTVTPNVGHEAMKDVIRQEPDLSPSVLRLGGFSELLTTLAGLGIVLKPSEYQYSALQHSGMSGLGEELRQKRMTFSPEACTGHSEFSGEDFSPGLAELLAPLLSHRSGLYPHLPNRMIRVVIVKSAPPPVQTKIANDGILEKIARSYASYRLAFQSMPKLLDEAMETAPGFYARRFFGELLTDQMAKVASSSHALTLRESPTALYFYNAHREHFSSVPSHWQLDANPTSPARALLRPVL